MCNWGEGRVALVTGGARRVGRRIATSLHNHGYNLVLHCNSSLPQAQEFATQLNTTRKDSVTVIQADLSTDVKETTARVVAEAVKRCGQLDLLVNNAAVYYSTPIATTSSDQWDHMMNTNAKAPYFLIQAAAPHLKKTKGVVVNVADIIGERPRQPLNVYAISKAAVIMVTKSLALELAPEVRVNYVNPGAAMWPEDMPEEPRQAWLSRTALGRAGTGEEVSDAVVFLASPSASYMTGNGINVCGGRNIQL
ncbi:hypothetical protein Pcinc_012318 [Petrolisthes cinctipes]|uniref:Pteridine reductase n=1 Tax=Petrolisthes cinctipes TaxID=88211 RepID=A0AAE1G237_PETCI|nr:hypothetical protein Pcinc_012318 [Petrolisthes cinctipes]